MTPSDGGGPYLTPSDLAARWGCTREWVWRLARDGHIPPGTPTTSGRIWTLTDIEAYEQTPEGQARLTRKDTP